MESIKVYTLDEIMDILKVTKRTLYNYIKANQIKAFKVGKEWRVTAEALKDFMEHGTQTNYLDKL